MFRRIIARNTGPPMRDMTTPTGMLAVVTSLDRVSARTRNAAPTSMDAGMMKRLSEPRTSLTMFGATRPRNPITPT